MFTALSLHLVLKFSETLLPLQKCLSVGCHESFSAWSVWRLLFEWQSIQKRKLRLKSRVQLYILINIWKSAFIRKFMITISYFLENVIDLGFVHDLIGWNQALKMRSRRSMKRSKRWYIIHLPFTTLLKEIILIKVVIFLLIS